MSSFNTSSLRSAHSPLRHQTTPEEHAVAHEVLLVAILTHIAKAEETNMGLHEIRRTVESLIGTSNPNANFIASNLINEAAEKLEKGA